MARGGEFLNPAARFFVFLPSAVVIFKKQRQKKLRAYFYVRNFLFGVGGNLKN